VAIIISNKIELMMIGMALVTKCVVENLSRKAKAGGE